ncbi:MAG: hypothetical protein KAS66_16480 [Candidatus Omnitrophica bacterium]|nr:hypothetical protein [Candidatus Omnitrophota bacterium]
MIKAVLDRQLMISVNNDVGTLAAVTSVITSTGINLLANCAYAVGGKAAFMFVTDDNNSAKKLLESHGVNAQEEEVILLSIDNKPGVLRAVTEKMAEAGINLTLMYGSVDPTAEVARLVLIAKNNLDVMMLIKTELERS